MKKAVLTTGEAAAFCGVNFRTVIRWIEKGRLEAYQLPGRGDNRIPIEGFVRFLEQNGMPVPKALRLNDAVEDKVCITQSKSILVVEDEVPMAKAIKRVLLPMGYVIHLIHNSFEAGAALVQHRPELMTLDLSMPGLNGFQVLESVKARYQHTIKILVISALPQHELEQALVLGADDVLNKPFKIQDLKEKVSNLLIKVA